MKLYQAQALASLILKEDLLNVKTFAEKIGYARTYLYEFKNNELPQSFIETIEAKLDVKLTTKSASSELHTKNDGAEIIYWEKCKDYGDYTISSRLRTAWSDKEIIKGFWGSKSADLRCIRAFDDRMEDPNCNHSIEEGDILLFDTARTDYTNGGVFLYSAEINGFKFLRIARIAVKAIEGVVVFSWINSNKYTPKTYTPDELKKAKFQVHGRILHNASKQIK